MPPFRCTTSTREESQKPAATPIAYGLSGSRPAHLVSTKCKYFSQFSELRHGKARFGIGAKISYLYIRKRAKARTLLPSYCYIDYQRLTKQKVYIPERGGVHIGNTAPIPVATNPVLGSGECLSAPAQRGPTTPIGLIIHKKSPPYALYFVKVFRTFCFHYAPPICLGKGERKKSISKSRERNIKRGFSAFFRPDYWQRRMHKPAYLPRRRTRRPYAPR